MPTPHISAQPGEFADVAIMPGDPLRAQLIAETYLTDARQVTSVRNMYGYTGTYKGKRISIMAHGMGIPSCSIYATELVREYGVKTLIRVGSCGGLAPEVKDADVILALGASTDSKVNRIRFLDHDFAAIADFGLVERAVAAARARQLALRIGNVFSSDLFYTPQPQVFDVLEKMGIVGVEMEAAGLYAVAAEHGAKALALLTVSDHIRRGEHLSSDERRTTFDAMMQIALDMNKGVDIHLHEPGASGIAAIRRIADMVEQTPALKGRVTISHAFSLMSLNEAEVAELAYRMASLDISVASTLPFGGRIMPIPALLAQGVRVYTGTDSVQSIWSVFGSCDVLEKAKLACQLYGWGDEYAISQSLKIATGGLSPLDAAGKQAWPKVGDAADMVLVRASCSAEAVARLKPREVVFYGGNIVA